jgi:hypothetical protein
MHTSISCQWFSAFNPIDGARVQMDTGCLYFYYLDRVRDGAAEGKEVSSQGGGESGISRRTGRVPSVVSSLFSIAGQFASLIQVKIAMAAQTFLQSGSCPMQPDLYSIEADPEDLGNLEIFQAFDLAEDQDRPVILRELLDIFPDTAIHLLANQCLVDILPGFARPEIFDNTKNFSVSTFAPGDRPSGRVALPRLFSTGEVWPLPVPVPVPVPQPKP